MVVKIFLNSESILIFFAYFFSKKACKANYLLFGALSDINNDHHRLIRSNLSHSLSPLFLLLRLTVAFLSIALMFKAK